MKLFITVTTFILSIGQCVGQTDKAMAIENALASRSISALEEHQGKYKFEKHSWDQLNHGIEQSNWQLSKKGIPEQIGLMVLTQYKKIIYIEAYSWKYNSRWNENDNLEIWKYSTLGSKGDLDSMVDFNHLPKLPTKFTFGFGCGASGTMPQKGERMFEMVIKRDQPPSHYCHFLNTKNSNPYL